MDKPKVFIASSGSQLERAAALAHHLESFAEPRLWDRTLLAGGAILDGLVEETNTCDFALFFFAPDDKTVSKDRETESPRDNVVFEAGLFGGKLGMKRAILLRAPNVKYPSDLEGLKSIEYDPRAPIESQAKTICESLAHVFGARGLRRDEDSSTKLEGRWWQFAIGSDDSAEKARVSFMEVSRHPDETLQLTGNAWAQTGDALAKFESVTTRITTDPIVLTYHWEGSWPKVPEMGTLFGQGEIELRTERYGVGYFTTRSTEKLEVDARQDVVYMRATPEDVEIIVNRIDERRPALIERLIDQCEAIRKS